MPVSQEYSDFFSEEDRAFMRQAIDLAKKGGRTSPNPQVGAVLVKDQTLLSMGYHLGPGFPHAEIDALSKFNGSLKDVTLYVTLEPCSHTKKRTPPCTDRLLKSGISRIVVGAVDPNPQVNGAGIELLRRQGLKVEVGCLKEETEELIRFYSYWMNKNRPYVILKSALSLDGKIALSNGVSKWITCEESRKKGHQLRAEVDAILVGSGTALKDDPDLTVRHVEGKNPIRIVLDTGLKLPPSLALFQTTAEAHTWLVTASDQKKSSQLEKLKAQGVEIIFCETDSSDKIVLSDLLSQLGKLEIMSLLIEGGPEIWTNFVRAEEFQEIQLFLAPFFIGKDGKEMIQSLPLDSLKEVHRLDIHRFEKSGEDLSICLRLKSKI